MKIISLFILIFFILSCHAQKAPKFNLGFEKQSDINELSDDWLKMGTYDLTIDAVSYSSQKSGKITSTGDGQFGSIVYMILACFRCRLSTDYT